jgi:UDP-N-acetylglucosamine transferase subunit ALG13
VIFVTVGSDEPFDRLILAVDRWAGEVGRRDVFAQVGRSRLRPKYIEHTSFLEPPIFADRLRQASVVVSHAGMGTILTALYHRRPLLVMPRRAAFGETRSDHQVATARQLRQLAKIHVAADEVSLFDELVRIDTFTAQEGIAAYAQPELISAIRSFIRDGSRPGAFPR